eukprot:CAMPEP_0170556938 /NCGR_PEP_ID=MMETSP0211-20121228/19073_1 /TAXON_ID=311385 /ORGANISM="Pseudokeronopsis sp., Strain OXSARD2" /LENGTH=49 /DNA_ID=CAMNT_0010867569 /DNA_START=486 /DNA_END=635 /DNA_ORIENTATION=+
MKLEDQMEEIKSQCLVLRTEINKLPVENDEGNFTQVKKKRLQQLEDLAS